MLVFFDPARHLEVSGSWVPNRVLRLPKNGNFDLQISSSCICKHVRQDFALRVHICLLELPEIGSKIHCKECNSRDVRMRFTVEISPRAIMAT